MTKLFALLDPYRWIALAILIAALAIGIPLAKHHYDATQQGIGYQKRAEEDKAASDAQTARNLDLQRAAEKRYTVEGTNRDRFITLTTKEIVHDAAPLAVCPVPDNLRLQLNAARKCALGDSPSACGPDEPVRKP